MPAPRPSRPLHRDLTASCVDGSMFSVMVGAGETYFAAFALALGFDNVEAGLYMSVPLLAGGALQLVSPWAVKRLRSNGRWTIWTATVQAVSFVPLIVAAFAGAIPTAALVAVIALYFAAGYASGPAWTTWIETIVPARIASHYFARRAVWCYVALLASVVATGAVLEAGDAAGHRVLAFAAPFALALVARVVSVRCLVAQSEPLPQPDGERHVSMTEILRGDGHRPARRFLLFLLTSFFAIQVSTPYVTSYLRGVLEIPYWGFALLLAVPTATRIVSLTWLGGIARRLGARRLMWIGSVALIPAAALWPLSQHWGWIAFVQVVTGFALAAFDLANLLLWFETIGPQERTSVLTTYQFWHSAAVVVGSLVGASVIVLVGGGVAGFATVFLASAAARVVATALFARTRAGRVAPSR